MNGYGVIARPEYEADESEGFEIRPPARGRIDRPRHADPHALPRLHGTPVFAVQLVPSGRRASIARTDDEVARKFHELSALWKEATVATSSVREAVLHPAYQQVIGLGPQVVPHILDALAEETAHWFWALVAIVGHDEAAHARTLLEARAAWLEWGQTFRP